MRVINKKVASSWASGVATSSHTGNFWTDGVKLYSYRLLIGDTSATGEKVLRDHTARGKWGFSSQTTSCHVNMAKPYADMVD